MEDFEPIFVALASLMDEVSWVRPGDTAVQSFIETSRRVKLFSDATEQPACYQAEHGDDYNQVSGMPYRTILGATWIIYQNVGRDNSGIGAQENNLIIGGVLRALKPKPQDPGFFEKRNTLGGKVWHCFVQGRLFKDPGDIDDQGMITVPIKLLIP